VKRSKLGALCAATAISATGLVLPLAQSAPAATPSKVTCAKVTSGAISGGNVKSTFGSCAPTAFKAGGTGATTKSPPPGSQQGQVGFKITWKNGMGTTTAAISFKVVSKGKCVAPYDTRISAKGTVKVVTGKAALTIKKGEAVSAFQCVVSKGAQAGKSTLEPGTKFQL
jgi:hypothetical protein